MLGDHHFISVKLSGPSCYCQKQAALLCACSSAKAGKKFFFTALWTKIAHIKGKEQINYPNKRQLWLASVTLKIIVIIITVGNPGLYRLLTFVPHLDTHC